MIRTNTKITILLHLGLIFSFFCVFIFLSTSIALAQEQVTITTYYPAPYGIYKELRADQMAVGSTYRAFALTDGNLIVSGNVGIGTSNPGTKLQVNMVNANDFFSVNNDANIGVELRSGTTGGTPYIDFSKDGLDYDQRIWLTGTAANSRLSFNATGTGALDVREPTNTCVQVPYNTSPYNTPCPAGTHLTLAWDSGNIPVPPGSYTGTMICCRTCTNPDNNRNGFCDD